MSRIGKQPVSIPAGVEIKLAESRITVKGPKGELVSSVPGETKISVEDNSIIVERTSDTKSVRALHGLTQKLIENMVRGVTSGYEKALEITGVGYRAQVQGSKIMLSLGYSHPVEFLLPEGINAAVDQKQTKITLSGIDKH
jgi:large subunit ribosomal protein L6